MRSLATLRHKLELLEGLRSPADSQPVGTSVAALDRLLPAGGLRRGTLVEYLAGSAASGAGTLALAAARIACQEEKALVVVDRQQSFYPLAAAAWGIGLSRTVMLHPADAAEQLWATDQALRCPGVGAVWLTCGTIDDRDFRRLQLAAESGGTLGLLVRPAKVRGKPTWSDVQWLVQSLPSRGNRRLSVELVRCRGGVSGQVRQLEWDEARGTWEETSDHATHSLHPPAELAHPTTARRRSRA